MGTKRAPTGGQLLGHVVDAFQLHEVVGTRLPESVGRTSQRYLAEGSRIRNPCAIVCAWGWMLAGTPECECGAHADVPRLFRPLLFSTEPSPELSRIFALAVHAHADAWDRFVVPRLSEAPDVARAFMRFGTLDLAVKTAVARRRAGLPAPTPGQPPAWADRARVAEPLRTVMDGILGDGVGLELLARRCRVSVAALGKWRRGSRRPKHEYLLELLALVPESRRAATEAELSRHYGLAALHRKVEAAYGEPFARDLALVFTDAVACLMASSPSLPERNRLLALLGFVDDVKLALSSWLLPPTYFIQIAAHHAPTWLDDIRLATSLWQMPFDGPVQYRPFAALNWAAKLHGSPPLISLEPRTGSRSITSRRA